MNCPYSILALQTLWEELQVRGGPRGQDSSLHPPFMYVIFFVKYYSAAGE